MLKVGLTGNYGSGHNKIVEIFRQSGTPVFDADLVVKWLLNHNQETIREIKSKFGNYIYSYGLINLNKFDDNKKFEQLLDVITPHLFRKYNYFRLKSNSYAYTIFLSSVLFEKGWNEKMNYSINVFKPQISRKKDLRKTTTMHLDMIEFILGGEMCEFAKNCKADFIISNYAEDRKIENQISQIHSNLIRNCENLDFIKTF